MIVARDLKVNYRWRQEPVLKGIDGIFSGKSLILGPNGSGKTTLFSARDSLARARVVRHALIKSTLCDKVLKYKRVHFRISR